MCKLIDELQESKDAYMSAIARIEDSNNLETKSAASKVIEEVMIHEAIALDEISNQG